MKNSKLYQINTRIWIKRFYSDSRKLKLSEVPELYWKNLANNGIEYVWLMGIWETCSKETISKYCFTPGLQKEYKRALKDWKEEDIVGSPYAINNYRVNPELGDLSDLKILRDKLDEFGLKLILDFIPNHFCAETELLREKPEIFLSTDDEHLRNDPYTYFRSSVNDSKIFAHGRDPFYPAWEDTVQVNYFSPEARKFMIEKLLEVSKLCDGVRCDMAMLDLNNVFKNTWGGILDSQGFKHPEKEFWEEAITEVKKENPNFKFIAEAYWDLEWQLQQLGFDFTYDKKLTDRLLSGDVSSIREHLLANNDYQFKSIRFIENHDEERAFNKFGKLPSMAAAVIISTIQGVRFYHDGQIEGKKIKLPIQLGREPIELPQTCMVNFYNKLFKITRHSIFKDGMWKMLKPIEAWDGDETYENFLAWEWRLKDQRRLVVVNYSFTKSRCRIKFDLEGYPHELSICDELNDQLFIRSSEEIYREGLYIELLPWQSHIFSF